ncbi:MAG TPA: hypothetical protein PKI32_01870 [Opitutales bacterium]|nr:hypothetical protein [Opitutales bacterium]
MQKFRVQPAGAPERTLQIEAETPIEAACAYMLRAPCRLSLLVSGKGLEESIVSLSELLEKYPELEKHFETFRMTKAEEKALWRVFRIDSRRPVADALATCISVVLHVVFYFFIAGFLSLLFILFLDPIFALISGGILAFPLYLLLRRFIVAFFIDYHLPRW